MALVRFPRTTVDFNAQLEILTLQQWLLIHTHPPEERQSLLAPILSQEQLVWEQISNLREWKLLGDLRIGIRSNDPELRQQALARIAQDSLFLHRGPCLSQKAALYLILVEMDYLSQGNPLSQHAIQGRSVFLHACLEKQALLADFVVAEQCLWAASNLLLAAWRLSLPEHRDLAISAWAALIKANPAIDAEVRQHIIAADLYGALMTFQPELAKAASKSAMNFLRDPIVSCSTDFKYRIVSLGMYLNLVQGRVFMSVRFANLVRNEEPNVNYIAWHTHIVLLHLLCLWLAEDWDQLGSETRHVGKWLRSNHPAGGFVFLMSELLQVVAKSPKTALIDLQQSLDSILQSLVQPAGYFYGNAFAYDILLKSMVSGSDFRASYKSERGY